MFRDSYDSILFLKATLHYDFFFFLITPTAAHRPALSYVNAQFTRHPFNYDVSTTLRPQGLGDQCSNAQEQQRGKGLRGGSVAAVSGAGLAELGLDEGGGGGTLAGIWGRVDVLPEARSRHDDLVVD